MSHRTKLGYSIFLFALLLAPLTEFSWPALTSEKILRRAHRTYNFSPYLHRILFEETAPIDVAIFGASHVRAGISAPTLKKILSETLRREVVVTHVPLVGAGIELQQYVASVLMERRQVKLILIDADINPQTAPNFSTCTLLFLPHWWPTMTHLGAWRFARFYTCAVASLPRLLMTYWDHGTIRRDLPDPSEALLGGMVFGKSGPMDDEQKARTRERIGSLPMESLMQSSRETQAFEVLSQKSEIIPLYLGELMANAKAHHTQVSLLRFVYPDQMSPRIYLSDSIRPLLESYEPTVIGVSSKTLLDVSGRKDLAELFFDKHLTEAGSTIMAYAVARPTAALLAGMVKP